MPVLRRDFRDRLVAWGLLALLAVAMAAPAHAFSRKVAQIVTPAGIKVWLAEEHSIPLVAIRFAFEGGALQDPEGRPGLASILASLLSEGAGDKDSAAFARALADAGAKLEFSAARDQIYGGLDVLPKHLPRAAGLLRSALAEPRFDADAVARVKSQLVAELEIEEGNPRSIAFRRWYRDAFPGHPYGRPEKGTTDTVRAVTGPEIVAQHRKLIARSNLRVVVVGDIDEARVGQVIDDIFSGLPAEAALAPVAPAKVNILAEPVTVSAEQPLATAAFGGPGVAPGEKDYPAMLVLRQIVGSGDFDSVLMDEIRVKRGLAYAVSISSLNDSTASVLLGGMATKTENMRAALDLLREVLAKFITEGPTQAQFTNAQHYLTGSYLLDFDTNAKLAASLLRLWLQGLDPGHIERRNGMIEAVTLADVRRVASRLLDPKRLNITIVGKLP
jgi:zinc protease